MQKLKSALKLIRNNLLRLTLLAIGAVLITWINPLYVTAEQAQASFSVAATRESTTDSDLPVEVKTAVVNDVLTRTNQTASAIKILEVRSQSWSDGCLGLGNPDEICLQAITPGYRLTVTDGMENWTYRTDSRGNTVRLEED